MRCLIYQTASDRLHNVQMGISAFLWRQPETESALARGPGAIFRVYLDGPDGRQRQALRWGFEPAWVGREGLQRLGMHPWPWVSIDRAPVSRVFAHPLRYQRCLVPADVALVGEGRGCWLQAPANDPVFLAGVWDEGTFALLTVASMPEWQARIGMRMPVAIQQADYDRWLKQALTCVHDVAEIVAARRTDWTLAPSPPAVDPVSA